MSDSSTLPVRQRGSCPGEQVELRLLLLHPYHGQHKRLYKSNHARTVSTALGEQKLCLVFSTSLELRKSLRHSTPTCDEATVTGVVTRFSPHFPTTRSGTGFWLQGKLKCPQPEARGDGCDSPHYCSHQTQGEDALPLQARLKLSLRDSPSTCRTLTIPHRQANSSSPGGKKKTKNKPTTCSGSMILWLPATVLPKLFVNELGRKKTPWTVEVNAEMEAKAKRD